MGIMSKRNRSLAGAAAAAALALAPACTALDVMDGVMLPASGSTSMVTGEIRSLDSRNGRMQVREQGNNRTQTLRYDSRTRVVHRQRQYPITALERGDVVRVRVSRDRSGSAWADHVEVRESVQERRASNARVERVDGTVRLVDTRRGLFTVEQSRNRTVTVYVPRNMSRDDARRFDRLRRGERVRADVRSVGGGVAELVRFR